MLFMMSQLFKNLFFITLTCQGKHPNPQPSLIPLSGVGYERFCDELGERERLDQRERVEQRENSGMIFYHFGKTKLSLLIQLKLIFILKVNPTADSAVG